ncbi:hypothetical protein EON63_02045 [archaeon]|nr:MAG: hypothetical protein EON63_02045 [archaeon]
MNGGMDVYAHNPYTLSHTHTCHSCIIVKYIISRTHVFYGLQVYVMGCVDMDMCMDLSMATKAHVYMC